MSGLEYVFNGRVRYNMPRMDPHLCEQLAKALQLFMRDREESWVLGTSKLTRTAERAFELFAEFTVHVDGFRVRHLRIPLMPILIYALYLTR